jgi:hypothetical protein
MTRWSLGGHTVNTDGGFGRMREMVAEPDEPWAQASGTCLWPCLLDHIATGTA